MATVAAATDDNLKHTLTQKQASTHESHSPVAQGIMAGDSEGESSGLEPAAGSADATAVHRKSTKHKASSRSGTGTTPSRSGSRESTSGKSGTASKRSKGSGSRKREEDRRSESRTGPPPTRVKPKGLKKSISMSDFTSDSHSLGVPNASSLQRKGSASNLLLGMSTGSEKDVTDTTGLPNLKAMKKPGRRRTASVGASAAKESRTRTRSRSSSPRKSLNSGLAELQTDQPSRQAPSLASASGSASGAAGGSLASSSMDISENRRKKSMKERKSSRSHLLDSSSRRQTSRRHMSDGSKKAMPDGSHTMDSSRSSTKQKSSITIIDDIGDQPPLQIKKPLTIIDDIGDQPPLQLKAPKAPLTIIDDVGGEPPLQLKSTKKPLTIIDDMGNEPPMQVRSADKPSLAKDVASSRRKIMPDGSERKSLPSKPTTQKTKRSSSLGGKARKPPHEQDISTGELTMEEQQSGVNKMSKKGDFEYAGFPASSSFETDFGHLPDFEVGDFSFGDLSFPFDSTDPSKKDDTKAVELSSKDEAKESREATRKENTCINVEPAESKSIASGAESKAKAPPPIWVCPNCQEQHDESELQFCGMCGADRPKVTPKQKRAIRKSSGHSGKRDGITRTPMKRSNTLQSQDDSAAKSIGSRKSQSSERHSPAGGLRRMRSKDKSGLGTTPRSRSKSKVRAPDTEVSLIVKCLDGDEGEAIDVETLNQQLTTFETLHPPMTPMRTRKNAIRRVKSDITAEHRMLRTAGRTPTSAAPQTPRSLGKKKLPRSQSFADPPTTPGGGASGPLAMMRKHSIRQAIPRRPKSNATEYLQQLQQNQNFDTSGDGEERDTVNEWNSESAHSIGANSVGGQSSGAKSVGGIGLSPSRASLVKSASSRILGGLTGLSNTFAIGGVSNVVSNAIGITKPKGDALLLDSDDDGGDDDDEFANELHHTAVVKKPADQGMLRDFAASGNSKPTMLRGFAPNDKDFSKSPRQPTSTRNVMAISDESGVPQTPRRRRASIAAARQARADSLSRTPRRRRNSVEPKGGPAMESGRARSIPNKMGSRGGLPFDDDDDDDASEKKSVGSGVLDYDDIDIDEEDEEDGNDAPIEESLGYPTTPRRTRERLTRPMPRRSGEVLAKSDHGAVTPKNLNARSRIRRASMTGFQPGIVPDLDVAEPAPSVPPTPGTLNARRRIRRASLGGFQAPLQPEPEPEPEAEPAAAAAKAKEADDIAISSGHGHRARLGRRGRSGRRGSIENPMLQQALAHMPQDPTHAVRSDIQEEWKRQEQMEGMRKKAIEMQVKYSGGLGEVSQPASTPLFDAEFGAVAPNDKGNERYDGEASGADLELAGEVEDVSDISSQGG